MILKSQLSNGVFSFSSFYTKRARRLMPAYIVTLVFTCIASAYFFPASLFKDFGNSLLYASLSISNIYFYLQSGYFDGAAELKPLLHCWSLSVEEQFYLIWPFSLVFLCKRFSNKIIITIVSLISILSLIVNLKTISIEDEAGFFWTILRIYEFAFGILLTYIPLEKRFSSYIYDAITGSGLLLIFYAIFTYNKTTLFPGLYALIPCFGTTLVLYAGDKSKLSRIFLANLPMVFVGKISYSLYLVHWPIYVFIKYHYYTKFTRDLRMLVVGSSFLFAICLYYLVEEPVRRKKVLAKLKPGGTGFVIALTFLFIAFIGSNIWGNKGFPDLKPLKSAIVLKNIKDEAIKKRKQPYFNKCYKDTVTEKCFTYKKYPKNILLIGDSFAEAAYLAFKEFFSDYNVDIVASMSCRPILESSTRFSACKVRNDLVFKNTDLSAYEKVFMLGGYYRSLYFGKIKAAVDVVANQGPEVYVLGPALSYHHSVKEVFEKYSHLKPDTIFKDILPKVSEKKIFCFRKSYEKTIGF